MIWIESRYKNLVHFLIKSIEKFFMYKINLQEWLFFSHRHTEIKMKFSFLVNLFNFPKELQQDDCVKSRNLILPFLFFPPLFFTYCISLQSLPVKEVQSGQLWDVTVTITWCSGRGTPPPEPRSSVFKLRGAKTRILQQQQKIFRCHPAASRDDWAVQCCQHWERVEEREPIWSVQKAVLKAK